MGNFLGDKRIRLLEAIDQQGSISQAAKAVPMSYKAAWDAVDDMNNVAPQPLVHPLDRRAARRRHRTDRLRPAPDRLLPGAGAGIPDRP